MPPTTTKSPTRQAARDHLHTAKELPGQAFDYTTVPGADDAMDRVGTLEETGYVMSLSGLFPRASARQPRVTGTSTGPKNRSIWKIVGRAAGNDRENCIGVQASGAAIIKVLPPMARLAGASKLDRKEAAGCCENCVCVERFMGPSFSADRSSL